MGAIERERLAFVQCLKGSRVWMWRCIKAGNFQAARWRAEDALHWRGKLRLLREQFLKDFPNAKRN